MAEGDGGDGEGEERRLIDLRLAFAADQKSANNSFCIFPGHPCMYHGVSSLKKNRPPR